MALTTVVLKPNVLKRPTNRRRENHRKWHLQFGPPAILVAACFVTTRAFAFDSRVAVGLRRLDPQMRLKQVCDLEAMERIGRESTKFRPDRANNDIISHPQHIGDTLKAAGAAFRSKKKWYAFSFVCKATPDHMKVISFEYTIGDLISEAIWNDYGL